MRRADGSWEGGDRVICVVGFRLIWCQQAEEFEEQLSYRMKKKFQLLLALFLERERTCNDDAWIFPSLFCCVFRILRTKNPTYIVRTQEQYDTKNIL